MGDFNEHVRNFVDGIERIQGGYGQGQRNQEGERVWKLANSFDIIVVNKA